MNPDPNVPAWRMWLVTALAALWGILAITTAVQNNWPIFGLCLLMFAWNLFQLWTFTRARRP